MSKLIRTEITFIDNERAFAAFLHDIRYDAVRFVGFDTEYIPGEAFPDGRASENARKRRPLLASFSVVVRGRGADSGKLVARAYVVDLRIPSLATGLSVLGKLNHLIVGHFLHTDLLTLLLNGVDLRTSSFFDTFLAAKHLELGRCHAELEAKQETVYRKYGDSVIGDIEADAIEEEFFQSRYSLHCLALRHDIFHAFFGSKEQLQQSFIGMDMEAAFTPEQIRYSFEDAFIACELYLAMFTELAETGTWSYLTQVANPLIPFLARSQFDGARLDRAGLEALLSRAEVASQYQFAQLNSNYGLTKFKSHKERKNIVLDLGLTRTVSKRGKISLDKKTLKQVKHRHPFLDNLFQAGAIDSTHNSIERLLALTNDTGFIHPMFSQVGAKTGRVTTSRPSPFDKRLRQYVITSDPNTREMFSLDVSGAEVWLLAVASGDNDLLRLCALGDVHLALGSDLVPTYFEPDDLKLIQSNQCTAEQIKALKKKYSSLRDTFIKPILFSVFYGRTVGALSRETGYKKSHIEYMLRKMGKRFPRLFAFIDEQIRIGRRRGYLQLRNGLRIHVSGSYNEQNRCRNNPIQALCSICFNEALLECYRIAQRFDGRIPFILYDGLVAECAKGMGEQCSQAMAATFVNKFMAPFPDCTVPAVVKVSRDHTTCWCEGDMRTPEEIIKLPDSCDADRRTDG